MHGPPISSDGVGYFLYLILLFVMATARIVELVVAKRLTKKA